MDILHLYKDYPPVLGGIEGHIQALAEAQAAAGHQVTVLVTNPARYPKEERVGNVKVVRVGRLATVASTPITVGFVPYLRRHPPQVTHLHFPYPVGELSQWAAGRKVPFVITYHSDIINPKQQRILKFYRPLLRRILSQACRIVVTSRNYLKSSPVLLPFESRCEIVPLGIDPRPFEKAQPLYPKGERPVLLFVGRHRYYKGVDVLLESMQWVDAELWIAGDGPMRADWEKQSSEQGLEDRVRFFGEVPVDRLRGLYASADLFVLPSTLRAEAFGIVLLEAMAACLPCVTTELGTGTSYLVQDGQTGLVVPPGDPQPLARALNALLADPALRKRMGEAGQRRVRSEFMLDQMVNHLDSIYSSVING